MFYLSRAAPAGTLGSARALTLAVVTAATLATAVYSEGRPEPSLVRIRREGVVRIGYAPEAPFAFRTPGGRVTGESPEVARAVFRALGVDSVEWVQTEFHDLIPDLQAGRFDVIAAGMYVTPERARQVAFSRPTFVAPVALLVRGGGASRIRSLADVRRAPGARVAVLTGADEGRLARLAGIPADRILPVPDPVTGVEAVRSGRVDAFTTSRPAVRPILARHPPGALAVVSPLPDTFPAGVETIGQGAFAFRRGDGRLRKAFDGALARFVGTPAHLRLVAPFGFGAADLPGRRP